ncbi:hypothetical protein GCM10010394_69310 [Streptomyces crystallinus]|uniref:4Fe-4S Mo/W bis-MGD-type domain-containing protein n=1 Tax=Streptomyces crystallinus TaxID=68191 RepID=A0ABP3SBR7_9ACTN
MSAPGCSGHTCADRHGVRVPQRGRTLTLPVQDNEIAKVTSPHDHPVPHGNLCITGRFGFQHIQSAGQ